MIRVQMKNQKNHHHRRRNRYRWGIFNNKITYLVWWCQRCQLRKRRVLRILQLLKLCNRGIIQNRNQNQTPQYRWQEEWYGNRLENHVKWNIANLRPISTAIQIYAAVCLMDVIKLYVSIMWFLRSSLAAPTLTTIRKLILVTQWHIFGTVKKKNAERSIM